MATLSRRETSVLGCHFATRPTEQLMSSGCHFATLSRPETNVLGCHLATLSRRATNVLGTNVLGCHLATLSHRATNVLGCHLATLSAEQLMSSELTSSDVIWRHYPVEQLMSSRRPSVVVWQVCAPITLKDFHTQTKGIKFQPVTHNVFNSCQPV